jgi:hypothetical protein
LDEAGAGPSLDPSDLSAAARVVEEAFGHIDQRALVDNMDASIYLAESRHF